MGRARGVQRRRTPRVESGLGEIAAIERCIARFELGFPLYDHAGRERSERQDCKEHPERGAL